MSLRIPTYFLVASVGLFSQSCASSYDVRHVRWGMSRSDVMRAEVADKPEILPAAAKGEEPSVREKDTVGGNPSSIDFVFTKDRLDEVVFNIDERFNGDGSGPLAAAKANEFQRNTYNWYGILQNRYGIGSIVFDEPGVPSVRANNPYGLQEALSILTLAKQTGSFTVHYSNSRTLVQLSCVHTPPEGSPDVSYLGWYSVQMDFRAKPEDNL